MKKEVKTGVAALSIGLILSTFSLSTVSGFFDENIDEIIAAAGADSVEGISATAGNGSVILIWNSKHNSEGEEAEAYRVEYGTQSVQEGLAEEYENKVNTIDNVPSIKIDDLVNDTKYYFTVIALFSDGTETNPSAEVSATPISNLEQIISETPVVISAESIGIQSVLIVFSEDVVIPNENPELAFAINEDGDDEAMLEVTNVSYDSDPSTGKELLSDVVVTTAEELVDGSKYRVTVSALITDTEGNPIESGSTDSALFTGFDGEVIPPEEEGGGEMSVNALPDDEGLSLEDILSELNDEEQQLTDTAGDTTPPEDITNLVGSFKARLTDFLVTLSWTPSIDSAGDLDDQLLYRSENAGQQWSVGVSLGKNTTRTNIPEKPETDITYKITTTDLAGNESVGVIRSLSLPALPATGAGLLIASGIALAGAGIRRYRKKD